MAETLKFEREICSRCGGCGRYSYCEMYGDTCFKCAGSGQMLTKRAGIARSWMNRQNLIQAKDVEVGMRIKGCGWTFTVKSIEREEPGRSKSLKDGVWVENPPGLSIRGEKTGVVCPDEYEFQLIRSREDQIELLKRAIEYQNSLTKDGKPRKVAA